MKQGTESCYLFLLCGRTIDLCSNCLRFDLSFRSKLFNMSFGGGGGSGSGNGNGEPPIARSEDDDTEGDDEEVFMMPKEDAKAKLAPVSPTDIELNIFGTGDNDDENCGKKTENT